MVVRIKLHVDEKQHAHITVTCVSFKFLFSVLRYTVFCSFWKNSNNKGVFKTLSITYDGVLVDTVNKSSTLHKTWSFSLRMPSVNMTKPAVSCGFGHIYWRNPKSKFFFCVQCNSFQPLTISSKIKLCHNVLHGSKYAPLNNKLD